jgi:Leucine-rich repeat (LRR) protein
VLELVLRDNRVCTIHAHTFANLTGLVHFDLSRNEMTCVSPELFPPLSDLVLLKLSCNKIRTLDMDSFAGPLVKLTSINLQYNDLRTMPGHVFANLEQLTELVLHDNEIEWLPVNAFAGLFHLTKLLLNNNRISTLLPGTFNDLTNLAILNFFNRLKCLLNGVFDGLCSVQELHLYKNQIDSVEAGAFVGLDKPESLHLNTNKLRATPDGVFAIASRSLCSTQPVDQVVSE